jgi:hypothetical protein
MQISQLVQAGQRQAAERDAGLRLAQSLQEPGDTGQNILNALMQEPERRTGFLAGLDPNNPARGATKLGGSVAAELAKREMQRALAGEEFVAEKQYSIANKQFSDLQKIWAGLTGDRVPVLKQPELEASITDVEGQMKKLKKTRGAALERLFRLKTGRVGRSTKTGMPVLQMGGEELPSLAAPATSRAAAKPKPATEAQVKEFALKAGFIPNQSKKQRAAVVKRMKQLAKAQRLYIP